MRTADYILPEHWLPALINGDYSGLDAPDVCAIEAFFHEEGKGHQRFWCLGIVDDSDNGFMRYHDAQPYGVGACDTYTVRFDVGE